MTDTGGGSEDSTLLQILRAAAHQFANRSYSDVSVEDVVAEAGLSKGALYSRFPSKHALALAIVDYAMRVRGTSVGRLLARRLSALETLVDVVFLIAVEDVSQELARARVLLLESIGRADGLHLQLLREQRQAVAAVMRSAVAEGDILAESDPEDASRLLIALYVGLRQSSDLDAPAEFLGDLGRVLVLVLPGLVPPDRIGYFTQFIRRRAALAVRDATPQGPGMLGQTPAPPDHDQAPTVPC